MQNRPITSREYKLMLNTDRFRQRTQETQAFWRMVSFLAQQQGAAVEHKGEEIRRRTWYLDTPARQLRQAGFVLRVRQEEDNDSYRITLKCRSTDRYLAARHIMDADQSMLDKKTVQEVKTKFEEDITPTVRKFAHSVSVDLTELPPLTDAQEAMAFFPALQPFNLPHSTPLQVVNGLKAYEVVLQVGDLDYGPKPDLKGCLSFWYLQEDDELPLVAEFSYDYDLPNAKKMKTTHLEVFPIEVVDRAHQLYYTLQRQPGWFDLSATTKTAYAYAQTVHS